MVLRARDEEPAPFAARLSPLSPTPVREPWPRRCAEATIGSTILGNVARLGTRAAADLPPFDKRFDALQSDFGPVCPSDIATLPVAAASGSSGCQMSERRRQARLDPLRRRRQGVPVGAEPLQEAAQVLRESRQRYAALFGQMLEGVAYCQMLFDETGQPADWIYLEVNPAFEALTGLRNVAGKRVTRLIPGVRETNPELFEIYGRVVQTGVPEQFETYLPALERWFLVKVYRPQPGDFAAVFENVTERKRLEDALRESAQHYRDVVENLAEGVVVQDAAGRIVTANAAAGSILGRDVDEMLGHTSFDPEWDAVWPDGTPAKGEDHPATVAHLDDLPIHDVVMGVRHSSGSTRWVSLNAKPLHQALRRAHRRRGGFVLRCHRIPAHRGGSGSVRGAAA